MGGLLVDQAIVVGYREGTEGPRAESSGPRAPGPGGDASTGHELALALRAAYLALHRRTDARLAPLGVTADQFVVLAALARDDAETQRDLVERTASDPSTLRAMLVLLEERGLVTRRPHPTDGRARSVRLTDRGRGLFTDAWAESDALRQRLMATLPRPQVEALTSGLNRIASLVRHVTAPGLGQGQARPRPTRSGRTRTKGT